MFMKLGLAAAAALAVAGAVPAAPPAERAPRIAAEDFGALPFFGDPVLSPDGSKLAAAWLKDDKRLIAILDLAAGGKPRFIAMPDKHHVMWSRWAGNGKLIVSLAIPGTFRGVEFFQTRLLAYDLATARFEAVYRDKGWLDGDNILHIDPAGRSLLLAIQQSPFDWPSVLSIDLATYQATEVVKPHRDVWNWYADSTGVVRAGLGSQGRRWWLLYRKDPAGSFEKVIRRRQSSDEAEIDKFVPVSGSDQGFAVTNQSNGRFGLYRYDFAADALGAPVFEHPEVDIDDFALDMDDNQVLAVEYTDDRSRVHWVKPEMGALQAQIDAALPGTINRVASSSKDLQTLVIHARSASNPGIFYLFDRKARRMTELAAPYAALDGKPLAETVPVRYPARDGLSIPAYLTLPVGADPAGKLPLIVMPHGGPFTRDKWEYDSWVQFLANRGYAVLQPNFRGSTGYGRGFVEAGSGQFGRKMQDDLDDGLAWLAARGTIDPKRVCMMGASYGGYAAMWAAARNPDLYRCAISFAGISDVPAMLKYDRKLFVAHRYYRDWRDRIRGDRRFDLDDVSPLKAVDRIAIPLLIAHGDADTNVPSSQSTALHEALEKAGKPHEYVIYKGEGHGFDKVENSVDFLKRVEAFLGRYNPA